MTFVVNWTYCCSLFDSISLRRNGGDNEAGSKQTVQAPTLHSSICCPSRGALFRQSHWIWRSSRSFGYSPRPYRWRTLYFSLQFNPFIINLRCFHLCHFDSFVFVFLAVKSSILDKETINRVISSMLDVGEVSDSNSHLRFIDAFLIPKLCYDSIRKMFYE